ncbi:protein NUCLEAR FUSION DEFECTIVE 4 [Andrographis paniculata]|uniref:protein NUCLEAR FUSION DEFECTIVE 4 n=1 Tax=Andrographis paniculata TaxID=175694 RepID=UPI0021E94857|nr:protein NUCLEAR FUSION DEFECTIVE 4 [Andrographis paniculata]
MAQQWLSLVGAIWLQAINGTNSNFPAYSSELKRLLSISQLSLNNLASASDAGKLLAWLSGVAAAHLPLSLVLLLGSLLCLAGYGVQYLFLAGHLSSLSYYHIFALTAVAGNGICWINTACYIIAIQNFPLDRQIAVGLSTSYVGLSAKIYTDAVDAVAPPSPSDRAAAFLLLNAVVPVAVCIAAAPLARRDVSVRKTRNLRVGFFTMFVVTVATGLVAVVTSLGSAASRSIPNFVILIAIVVLLLLPLVVPIVEKVRENVQQKCLIRVHDECSAASTTVRTSMADDREIGDKYDEIEVVQDINARMMVKSVEFWLYFFVYLFGVTLGLVYMNNLGQIAESRSCSGTSSLVSLSSAFSFFGRLLPSLIDYIFPRNKKLISRAGAMGMIMVPMSGALFLLLNEQHIFLYISTAIIGACTGAITSISVSTTTELFGTENFGVNHNIIVSNIPIGSFFFGDFAAILYRRRGQNGNCMGHQCYETTFMIWGSLCAFGVFLALILHARTKKLYSCK